MGRTASFVSAYRVGAFRYVASVGGGPVGEIVRFVEENGRVTRMITGDSYVERVPPTIGNIRAVSRLP